MKKSWSKSWKSSIQTRKQRKYQKNAPLHIKHKFLGASLSSDLRKKYSFRSLPVRVGDTVKIITGQFKGKEGKVTKVSLAKTRIHVEGATISKADGSDSFYPIHPSNVQIIKLNLDDEKRVAKIEKMKQIKEAKQ
jgi:large subunit ribosomal protein L24